MSLNAAQRRQTADELAANLDASGLTVAQLAERSGLTRDRVDAALAVAPGAASPRDVWIVRDLLETAVREAGSEPTAYTVLTERMRKAAAGWFGVTDRRES